MKKLIFLTAFLLFSVLAFGQGLQKGNLVGMHIITVTLQPGVTMDKFIEFYNTKVIPKYEGGTAYLVKSIRGQNKDSFGVFMVFKTEADRNKYYNPDGSSTALGIAADEKLKPVIDELSKLGTVTSVYNDWLVL